MALGGIGDNRCVSPVDDRRIEALTGAQGNFDDRRGPDWIQIETVPQPALAASDGSSRRR